VCTDWLCDKQQCILFFIPCHFSFNTYTLLLIILHECGVRVEILSNVQLLNKLRSFAFLLVLIMSHLVNSMLELSFEKNVEHHKPEE